MKRCLKDKNSEIANLDLKYKDTGNKKLTFLLRQEQNGFCAYTDCYLGSTSSPEIDHFNPNLKGKKEDGYHNYFLVQGKWNRKKSNKWIEPIMHPTDENLESRIIYLKGLCRYKVADKNDIEAKNMFDLLNIGDKGLESERQAYIALHKSIIPKMGYTPIEYFKVLLKPEMNEIQHRRAIEEEFNIKLDFTS